MATVRIIELQTTTAETVANITQRHFGTQAKAMRYCLEVADRCGPLTPVYSDAAEILSDRMSKAKPTDRLGETINECAGK